MADLLRIVYYTDPLCCWSWAFEKHWKAFRQEFGHTFHWNYVMGGMIPDWASFNDPLNSISKPIQMGPMWMHASQITHEHMDYAIWHEDPPASSYPACVAVKCAELQSPEAADLLLHKIREAVMTKRRNVSKSEILVALAHELAEEQPDAFDVKKFLADWKSGAGRALLKSDLQQAAYYKIGRFPTLTFSNNNGRGVMIVGYRPYDELINAYHQVQYKTVC